MIYTRITPQSQVSPLDRGLLYGDGFFTTALISNRNIVFWESHKKRLSQSAERLLFESIDWDRLESQLNDLPLYGILKVFVTRGEGSVDEGSRGYAIPKLQNNRCFIQIIPTEKFKTLPAADLILCQTPANENAALAGIKHLCRLDHVLARTEVEKAGLFEGIMLAGKKVICGTQSNVFFVQKDTLYTPHLKSSGVEGIMKSKAVEWLKGMGQNVIETDIEHSRLSQYDEVFLTNCVRGIVPVARINQYQYEEYASATRLQEKFSSCL